jgi:hypothetical protein
LKFFKVLQVAALKLESFDVFSQFIMVLFLEDCQFTVDLTSKHFPYKRKQEIRRRITDYGGTISYILNNKVCQNSWLSLQSTIVQQMLVNLQLSE